MRKIAIALLMLGVIGLVALPCLAADEKAPAAKPAPLMGKGKAAKMAAAKAPVVKLERVDIANYWSFYLDAKEKRGSALNLAFVFSMENPNNYKVMLDDMKFTVSFEEFEVNTITYFDDNYIPAKTTDHLRINGAFDPYSMMVLLLVSKGHRLQEMNVKAPDLVKKWWEEIQDFKFPIMVSGTATFVGPDGKNMIVPFEGTFPPKQ
jgi:hypothetical protein